MLTNPTPEQLRDLAGLVEHSRWARVNEMIEAEVAGLVRRMVDSKDTADLHSYRGAIKALQDFQSMARDAHKTLEKMGAPRPSL